MSERHGHNGNVQAFKLTARQGHTTCKGVDTCFIKKTSLGFICVSNIAYVSYCMFVV